MRLLTHILVFQLLQGFFLASATNVCAEEEMRLKLDLDYNVLRGVNDDFTLRPMVRTEQRFRDEGLVLFKVFVGARANLLPWFTLQTYYAHKDKFYTEHQEVHMGVLDLLFRLDIGALRLSYRNGNEWHSNPGFYRNRNYLDLSISPGLDWLRLFVADELRFDSDQERLNLNDFQVGANFVVTPELTLRTYYDLESNRRSMPDWALTHVLGMMVIVRL